MRPTRFTSLLIVPLLALALAACSGSSPAASKGGDGNGGQSTAASAEASSEASADTGGPGSSQDSGPGSGDVEGVANGLIPPNSTEITKTSVAGGLFVGYESTDSPDSLKGFYENAIPATGMVIITTSQSQGTYSWIFAENDQGTSFGGSVTVGPSSDTEGGSTVIISVTSAE
jgi:hypothetical protein